MWAGLWASSRERERERESNTIIGMAKYIGHSFHYILNRNSFLSDRYNYLSKNLLKHCRLVKDFRGESFPATGRNSRRQKISVGSYLKRPVHYISANILACLVGCRLSHKIGNACAKLRLISETAKPSDTNKHKKNADDFSKNLKLLSAFSKKKRDTEHLSDASWHFI